ncbi:MAG: zf-HC2 domain-containing protein [bacterium]|nr:MAG: zf-HC2 domain-containing protein [bacterium]
MNCREIKRKLSAYQDKELPGSQQYEIENHLKNCADCSKAFQEMNKVWELLSNVETIESAPFFWTKLSQRMKEKKARQWGWKIVVVPMQRLSFSVLTTFILVLGFLIGMYLGKNIYQHAALPPSSAVEQELDQVLSLSSFDDFPEESVAEVYVTLLSENNQ